MPVSINPMRAGIAPRHVGDPGGFRTLPIPPNADEGEAFGISADGNVIVGAIRIVGEGSSRACYWPYTDRQPIIIGSSEGYGSSASCASYDGSLIMGNTNTGIFRWTASTGMVVWTGSPLAEEVIAMTPDGKRSVGDYSYSLTKGQACYWNEYGLRTALGFLPGHDVSRARAVSANGKYIVGESYLGSGGGDGLRSFMWTEGSGMADLGYIGWGSRGFGVSDDGKLVCGDLVTGGNGAYKWTPTEGMTVLPQFVTFGNSTATCVSGDGSVIAGYAANVGPPYGRFFTYWSAAGTPIMPTPVQIDPGHPDLEDGENTTYPTAVSRDGRTFVGYTLALRSMPWVYMMGRCIPPFPIGVEALPVTPAPVRPWILEPDWADGVTERLLWKTDVITSQTGLEQRRRLRNAPRRQIEARFTLIGQDRQVYDSLMVGPAAGMWHYPLWWEKYRLISPASAGTPIIYVEDMTGSEVTSGSVILFRGALPFTMEIATVTAVHPSALELEFPLTRDWPQGSHFYITKQCRLTGQQRSSRRADNASQVTLTFDTVEPNDYAAISPPDIGLPHPILEITPNEADDMSFEYKRLIQEFDNQSASVPVRRDLANVSFMLQQFTYFTYGRRELADLRGLLYYLQGKLMPLYVPTYSRDVELIPSFYAETGTTNLSVVRSGYTEYVNAAVASRRLLMFSFRDGTTLVHTVASSHVVSDGQEVLTVEEPFYRPITNSLVSRISWLALSRQDQDDIDILHHADSLGPTTLTTTFATLIEGRNAQPYRTDVWNGSYVPDASEPVPSSPDGPLPPVVVDPVPLSEGDVSGPFGGSEGDGGPQGGDESQSAGFG